MNIDKIRAKATVLPQVEPTPQATRAKPGEYAALAVGFLEAEPAKKWIELDLSDGPLKGRPPSVVYQGITNALKGAGITKDQMTVMTRRGKIWLINVVAARGFDFDAPDPNLPSNDETED